MTKKSRRDNLTALFWGPGLGTKWGRTSYGDIIVVYHDNPATQHHLLVMPPWGYWVETFLKIDMMQKEPLWESIPATLFAMNRQYLR